MIQLTRWSALRRRLETIDTFALSGIVVAFLAVPTLAQTSFSACDLNQDGTVNGADVQIAINMALGSIPCTANIGGPGICNVAVVQRVVDAALGGECITGAGAIPHYVLLNWDASTSSNIAGYNVYRATVSGGPYVKINPSLIASTTYTDNAVQAGQIYYYVSTTVNTSNSESSYSNEAAATVPFL